MHPYIPASVEPTPNAVCNGVGLGTLVVAVPVPLIPPIIPVVISANLFNSSCGWNAAILVASLCASSSACL